jgi:hypothetical protein
MAALRAARQTYGDIAKHLGYSSRLLELYAAGERNVTPEAAGRLMDYLLERTSLLQLHGGELADALAVSNPRTRAKRAAQRRRVLAAMISME